MILGNVLMLWAGNEITDHNRSPLDVSIERIEKKQRMANGTLRRYVIAKKHTFSCSWEMLPHNNTQVAGKDSLTTVNGKDGLWMENFHDTTDGPFTLTLRDGRGVNKTYQVMISDFSKEVVKRGAVDLWNLNVSLEEV